MRIYEQSKTPNKSIVQLKTTRTGIEQSIKHINKKGYFKKREQCGTCKYSGRVHVGLGYHMDSSCDREEGYWREWNGISNRQCKFYEEKSKVNIERVKA